MNSDINTFLDETQVETLEAAARMVDDCALRHKVSFLNPSRRPFFPQTGSQPCPSNPSCSYSQTFTPKPKLSSENKDQNPLSQPVCNYCKNTSHIISECLYLKRKKEKEDGLKPTGLTSLRPKKVREKSRECHNHKPQPFPDIKRKRKPTNPNKHKSIKHTKST